MPILPIEEAMKSPIFNSPVVILFGILMALGCYVFVIWLIGGFLSFAKLVARYKDERLHTKKELNPSIFCVTPEFAVAMESNQ
jgi:amino acid transporter